MIKFLSYLQRYLFIPFQLQVSLAIILLYDLFNIISAVNNKLPVIKYVKRAIEYVPSITDRYHLKFEITYSLVLGFTIGGLIACWDPILLLPALGMRFLWSGIGAEVTNHRYLSHHSFKCDDKMENVLLLCSILSIEGPGLQWAAQHRVHHKYSDTEFDPHPGSKWNSTFSNIKTPAKIQEKITPMVVRDLLGNNKLLFIKDNYFTIYWLLVLLSLLVSVKFTIYFILLPGLFAMLDSMLVNWLCHRYGVRSFETNDKSTNNYWLNLWAPGGGLHNNHHANATLYHNETQSWEFDFFRPIIEKVIATETFKK